MSAVMLDGSCPHCGLRNHAPATCDEERAAQSAAVRANLPPLGDWRTAKVINDLISERRELRQQLTELRGAATELLDSLLAPYPHFGMGAAAQDAWAARQTKARDAVAELVMRASAQEVQR